MRASLLDGLSGRPRPGRAEIVGDELVFVEEDGQRLVWNVAQVLAQHRVAAERHLEIAAQKLFLHGVAFLRRQAGVVDGRRHLARQRLGERLGLLARRRVDDRAAGVGAQRGRDPGEAARQVTTGSNRPPQVRSVEGPDDQQGLAQPQVGHDVGPHLGRRTRGQGERGTGERGGELADRPVRGPKVVAPFADTVGFIDNDSSKKGMNFHGYRVFGGFEVLDDFSGDDVHIVNTITQTTAIRYETTREVVRRGFPLANLIYPTVDLRMARVGVGNYIQEAVQLQAEVSIGDNSSIHMGTLIGHETRIGNSTFIAHAVSISGLVKIGDGVTIGTNSTIIPRIKIGNWATIGAGAVVIRDVPDYAVAVGNPAKVIKYSEEKYADGEVFESYVDA